MKYGLVAILSLLFLRLRKERVLDHFVRGQLLGLIIANPGISYSQLLSLSKLNNGALAYHLIVLERTGFIRNTKNSHHRAIFAVGIASQPGIIPLSPMQLRILHEISFTGHTPEKDLAQRLGVSKQRVNYNVKKLSELGLIQISRGTPGKALTVSDRGIEALRRQPAAAGPTENSDVKAAPGDPSEA